MTMLTRTLMAYVILEAVKFGYMIGWDIYTTVWH